MEYRIGLEWNCLFSVSSAFPLINFSLLSSTSSLQFWVCCIVAHHWQTAGSLADLQWWQQRVVFVYVSNCITFFFRQAPSPGNSTRRCILNENKTNHPCFWPIPLCTSGEAFRNSTSKCVTCLKNANWELFQAHRFPTIFHGARKRRWGDYKSDAPDEVLAASLVSPLHAYLYKKS